MTGADGSAQGGLRPVERLTKASIEGLRYRAEDIARSLTKSAIKEVGCVFAGVFARPALSCEPFPGLHWTQNVVMCYCKHVPRLCDGQNRSHRLGPN